MKDLGERIRVSLEQRGPKMEWLRDQTRALAEIVQRVSAAVEGGGTVFACGNGGSASQADHFVGELVGRFKMERRPLRAIALGATGAVASAISNDYGFDYVFARQLQGLGRAGDVLVALSTSGRSGNVIEAVRAGQEMGILVVSLTGQEPNPLQLAGDVALAVPATDTAIIQEIHLTVLHLICEMLEIQLFAPQRA